MENPERTKFNIAFGVYIKNARLNKGLLQGEVSRHLGISQSYFCDIESGKKNVDLHLAHKICKSLGISLYDFLKKQK